MASVGLLPTAASSTPTSSPTTSRTDRAVGSARAPVAAAVLALALVARGVSLGAAHVDELGWLCHIATAAMVIGLAAGAARVVAGAWLFHLVWGGPMYLIDAILSGTTLPSSVAAHLGPLAIGGLWLARRPWPGPIALPAWMVGVAAMIVARPLTDPAHNVNAAYAVWPPYDRVFPSWPTLWLASTLTCLALMVAADTAIGRWRRGRR